MYVFPSDMDNYFLRAWPPLSLLYLWWLEIQNFDVKYRAMSRQSVLMSIREWSLFSLPLIGFLDQTLIFFWWTDTSKCQDWPWFQSISNTSIVLDINAKTCCAVIKKVNTYSRAYLTSRQYTLRWITCFSNFWWFCEI